MGPWNSHLKSMFLVVNSKCAKVDSGCLIIRFFLRARWTRSRRRACCLCFLAPACGRGIGAMMRSLWGLNSFWIGMDWPAIFWHCSASGRRMRTSHRIIRPFLWTWHKRSYRFQRCPAMSWRGSGAAGRRFRARGQCPASCHSPSWLWRWLGARFPVGRRC